MKEIGSFQNEPLIDWSKLENHSRMKHVLARVQREFGKSYPLLINSKKILTRETIKSVNPANFTEIVGVSAKATQALADRAMEIATKASKDWRKVPYYKRVEHLFKAAKIMRQRRFELIAWLIFETGKNWQEADADVAEAIDFLEYYGRQMIQLGEPKLAEVQVDGEINKLCYKPRGVCLVLGIWNFALAINTGMTAASIVTGNTAIFKPASLSPVIGYKMVKMFYEAGVPEEVLTYLPGAGQEVGEYLVCHPDTNLIVLTGSQKAGQRIDLLAAQHPHRHGFKKRILETGGKNAIIVDSDADLDQALDGVIASWLGYQGQKCSACSRIIVLEDIHDRFVRRLAEATRSLKMGDPRESGNYFGPLIDGSAVQKVREYIEIGEKEAKLTFELEILNRRGYYHGPVIFTDVDPYARIAQEEIFGPVLAVIKAKNFSQALEIANCTGYALTGGVYSRNPRHIKRAASEFDVGNLYINRPITGAVVGRQPFGGHRGSGTGPKAGGPEYLKAFMVETTDTENTVVRGFVPIEINESQR